MHMQTDSSVNTAQGDRIVVPAVMSVNAYVNSPPKNISKIPAKCV